MKLKKMLCSIIALAMVLGTMNFTVLAEDAETTFASVITSADELGVGAEGEYSTVYYGGIPWRALDKEFSDGQKDATNGIYLLSEYVYGYGTPWNAHYGPGDYVWNRTGIFTRLDVLYHPNGYNDDGKNTHPTHLGYQASDIRKYMTGVGEYEAVYPRSMHEHGNPDDANVSFYYEKTKVTESEPVQGVEYYIKGDFKLSTDSNNLYKTLSVGASDWLPDTWYTYDAQTGTYNLVEEAPAVGETLTCYHDATEYYNVGELESFEQGTDYYTFKKIDRNDADNWAFTKLEIQSNSIAKGALYAAYSVTDMKSSTSAAGKDNNGTNRVILSGENKKSFAADMGFSDIEKLAVLPTNREGYVNGGAKSPSTWTYKNSGAYSDTLVNDTYFLPTAADLNTYLKGNGHSVKATYADGSSAQYWLSSLLRYDRAGMVDSGGGEWYQQPSNINLGIRPAFNLNPDAVAFYAPVEDVDFAAVEGNTTNEYKLVLKDNSRDFSVKTISAADNVYEVAYSGATTGDNEYISAVVKGDDDSVVAYGKIASAQESGTITLDLSAYNMSGKKLYLFNEQCNGEKETNYASELVMVAPSLPSATVTEPVINTTVMARTYDGSLGNVSVETPLTFQMNFKADEPTDEQREYYSEWLADYELVINKDVRGTDGYLAGQYDSFFADWIKLAVDTTDVVIHANEPIKVVKDLMGLDLEYEADILDWVKEFDCGIYLTPEFIEANPDLEITLALKLYNPENPDESYTIGEAYEFTAADAMPQAQIGDTTYQTLAAAIEAAKDGDTVTVLKDFALDEMIVNKNKITLNLNGKTITGKDTTSKNFSLIDNRGELTITGNGTMTLTSTVNSGWNRYSAVLANNPGGKLVIENGTIEHLGGTDMAYGIDNLTNGKGTYAETVINGGTVKSPYRGIRQFLNGVEAQNILAINGGTVEGANKAIFFHDPSKNANSGTLTVTDNAQLKGDVYLFVTEGSTEWPVEVSIAKSAVEGEVLSANVPEGYEVSESNGVWGVQEVLAETISWNSSVRLVTQMGKISIAGLNERYGRIRIFGGIDDPEKYDKYGFKYTIKKGDKTLDGEIVLDTAYSETIRVNIAGTDRFVNGSDLGEGNTHIMDTSLCFAPEWISSTTKITVTPFVEFNGTEYYGTPLTNTNSLF